MWLQRARNGGYLPGRNRNKKPLSIPQFPQMSPLDKAPSPRPDSSVPSCISLPPVQSSPTLPRCYVFLEIPLQATLNQQCRTCCCFHRRSDYGSIEHVGKCEASRSLFCLSHTPKLHVPKPSKLMYYAYQKHQPRRGLHGTSLAVRYARHVIILAAAFSSFASVQWRHCLMLAK